MFNKQKVQSFRGDFQQAVAQLEKDYGVNISLGTISYGKDELRSKMTVKVGDAITKFSTKDDFKLGMWLELIIKKLILKTNLEFTKLILKILELKNLMLVMEE